MGVERPLAQGVLLIETLFNIPAPTIIQAYYKNQPIIQELVKSSIQALHDEIPTQKSISNYWNKLSYKMKLKKGLNYKMGYFNAISIRDYELIRLPNPLFFGYFWLRPFFWIWRYIFLPTKKS